MFAKLLRVLSMVISFLLYQVLFLTANSSLFEDLFDLVDRFLYFRIDVPNILL